MPWLVKSEPDKYPYARFVQDGRTVWDGVRNYQARNNLQAMRMGDTVLFYHSNIGKEVVGLAKVVAEAYGDPTSEPGDKWMVVDLEPAGALARPVTLADIKADGLLAGMALLKQSRLSVVPVTDEELTRVLQLAGGLAHI